MEIDETDRRIVLALLSEGREATEAVADTAEVNTAVVEWRLNRLAAAGVLEGIEPQLELESGAPGQPALLWIEAKPADIEVVCRKLGANSSINTVYQLTGPDDVLAIGSFVDESALTSLLEELDEDPTVRSLRVACAIRPAL